MKESARLHHAAMEEVDLALDARRKKDAESTLKHFRAAFELEKQAATLDPALPEPSRSVLLRSAAALGIECGEWKEAASLITTGLAGDPPAAIKKELEALRRSITARG